MPLTVSWLTIILHLLQILYLYFFVFLQNFSKQQETEMSILRQEAADAIELWMTDGIERAMNRYN